MYSVLNFVLNSRMYRAKSGEIHMIVCNLAKSQPRTNEAIVTLFTVLIFTSFTALNPRLVYTDPTISPIRYFADYNVLGGNFF